MRFSFRDSRGFGLVHMIISIGVLVGVLFVLLQKKGPSPTSPVADPVAVTNEVQTKLNEAAAANEKKMGCAIEEEGCETK